MVPAGDGVGPVRGAGGRLGALGEVDGLDVLELACGTAYCSAWLTNSGAHVVAVDLSAEQLRTARDLQRRTGPAFPLVQADADHLPIAANSFDLVVSEHGAAAWCDPERWLAEAARVLRPGGRLVFLTNSLLSALCVPDDEGVATEAPTRAARGLPRPLAGRWRRVPPLARRLDPSPAPVRFQRRSVARAVRPAGCVRPPVLRDRQHRLGLAVARRRTLGGPARCHP